jgi:dolichyl-phosphate beta-glucosyltransferase
MFLSVIIPCLNEEKRMGNTLQKILDFLDKQTYEYEIIIVDNGSKDKTVSIAQNFIYKSKNIKLIRRNSHGKGYAVREGMLEAKGDFRLFTDADNSTDISEIEKLLKYTNEGFDVIIGSRKSSGAIIKNPQPIFRILLGNIFQALVSLIIPLEIKDTQNGFKLFSGKSTEKIFTHQTIFYWAFDVEILAIAKKIGYKIKEVPIVWTNDDRSGMSFKGMLRMLLEIIIIRLNLWRSVYKK